jgi:hypothetical protein
MRIKKKHDELLAETPEARQSLPKAKQSSPTRDGQSELSELIARRAYELYEERGKCDGEDLDDWLRAEAEVRDSLSKPERKRTATNRAQRSTSTLKASASR